MVVGSIVFQELRVNHTHTSMYQVNPPLKFNITLTFKMMVGRHLCLFWKNPNPLGVQQIPMDLKWNWHLFSDLLEMVGTKNKHPQMVVRWSFIIVENKKNALNKPSCFCPSSNSKQTLSTKNSYKMPPHQKRKLAMPCRMQWIIHSFLELNIIKTIIHNQVFHQKKYIMSILGCPAGT